MSGRVRRAGGALVLVGAVVAGLPAGPVGAATERVEMADFRFEPARVQIEVGDTVRWEAGDDGHTVTARDGSFDTSSRGAMGEGDEFRWRFRVPGTYAYFCRVHQGRGMRGEVVVVDRSAATTTSSVLTPVTAAATTTSTAPVTTTTAAPTTTTTRELATSSSTSPAAATPTTVSGGAPAERREAPSLNPNAPVLNPAGEPVFPDAKAAARTSDESEDGGLDPAVAAGLGVLALGAGGGAVLAARRRRTRG